MKTKSAFTLVEILIVVTIMVILMAFVAPAVIGMLQGSQLTQAGQLVLGQLGLARQEAISQDAIVQERFYKFGDPSIPGQNAGNSSTWRFQAMQAFVITNTSGAVPLGKMNRLPQGIIFDSSAILSSIFDTTKRTNYTTPTVSIPEANLNYNYFEVQFYPDGSPDLAPAVSGSNQNWFFTIHNGTSGDNLAAPPANFWAIQIDPYNGVAKYYLP
jgi:uncharacterized protein (TIGR02596 family)